MTEIEQVRFWSKVNRSGGDDACWNWQAHTTRQGYGAFGVRTDDGFKNHPAHRIAYEFLKGPIPEGLVLDHLCRNRACVLHTEAVTHRENVLRGNGITARNAAKTHCDHGHALSGGNLYIRPDGRRACRTCKRDWERTHYAASKEGTT